MADLPEDAQKKFNSLKTLDFIKSGQNVILAGNPGTGKTHLAIGLGVKACLSGYKVLYTTVPITDKPAKRKSFAKGIAYF